MNIPKVVVYQEFFLLILFEMNTRTHKFNRIFVIEKLALNDVLKISNKQIQIGISFGIENSINKKIKT